MHRLKYWPLAPVFFAAYPVLYAYSINLGSVDASVITAPLLVVLMAALILNLACAFAMRNWQRGALITDFILFSSYLFTSVIDTLVPWIFDNSGSKIFATAVIAIILALTWVFNRLLRSASDVLRWTAIANLASLLLLFIPVTQIIFFHLTFVPEHHISTNLTEEKVSKHVRPDVYYIILDGYSRADILENDMGYNNSSFTNFLRRRGFFVADKSRSNYAYTYLSLASSLNMEYINEIDGAPGQEQDCIQRIHDSSVMRLFRMKGYKVIHIGPNWLLRGEDPYTESTFNPRTVNEFENLVMKRFLLPPFLKQGVSNAYKARTLYTLHRLQTLPEDPHSKFVFAHILCPHPPFVFDRNGNIPEIKLYPNRPPGSHDWYPKERYTDQIHYLNYVVEETVDHILKESSYPPIIIIQGDHGAACDGTSATPSVLMVRERMSILNAYFVPMELRKKLYPSITPVNTFRLIGDYLFHAQFSHLPDKSYYSGPMDATPYEFMDVRKWLPTERNTKKRL